MVDEQQCVTPPAKPYTLAAPHSGFAISGKRALIVDDDEVLARFLERMMRLQGLEVESAHSGDQAIGAIHSELDIVLLDLNLPGRDGISVLQHLRSRDPQLPVIVLTGRNRSEISVLALDSGADDCLTKPFSCVELMARLRAVLRRRSASDRAEAAAPIASGLALNAAEFRAIRDGKPVDLTPREFALLEYLMRSPGKAVPRAVLLKELWGDESHAGSNVVDVYMKYVRDKIDLPGLPKLIRTVRGVGYAIGEA